MKIYACVHHVRNVPIILGTQAALSGGWVLGPDKPATHAFLVLEHPDGLRWRLDGQPPKAEWFPMYEFQDHHAAWLIKDGSPLLIAEHARSISGVSYDWTEIINQAAIAAASMFNFLPFASRIASLGRKDWATSAAICTRVLSECLSRGGGELGIRMNAMPDLFPERLAQLLQSGEGKWTERVK